MTQELQAKLQKAVSENRNTPYTFLLNGQEVALVHALVLLALEHPQVNMMLPEAKLAGIQFLNKCRNVFLQMGITPAELDQLDKLRVEVDLGDPAEGG